jgi:hypothetical protein
VDTRRLLFRYQQEKALIFITIFKKDKNVS